MTTHIITTADEPVDFGPGGTWKSNPIAAGDTVEISAGTYNDVFKVTDCDGASGNRITFTNSGGVVNLRKTGTWAFLIENSNHLDFIFNGDVGNTYGLNSTNRIKIHDNNTNLTFRWLEIHDTPAIGFHIDQNDFPLVEITDITLEDCYIYNCGTEATYMGSNRNGKASNEHILRRVNQRRLIIDNCKEGPQINSCIDWEISDCVVTNSHPEDESAHNAAISIGKGAGGVGVCTRNTVNGCTGFGINVNSADNVEQSGDTMEISYNDIHNVGHTTYAGTSRHDGIKVAAAIPTVSIFHNTVTKCGDGTTGHGIRLADSDASAYDNICVDVAQDGISLSASVPAGNAHHNLSNNTSQSTNGIAYTESTIGFTNYATDDFTLISSSPAIGLSSTGNDIGRYQFEESTGGTPVTVNLKVSGSANDGRQLASGGMNITDTGHTINDLDEYLGFRFTGISIPQGATITIADLQIEVGNTSNDDPNLLITGDDIDNSPEFTTTNGDISNRTDTTASVVWVDTGVGTGFVSAPDISTIIQEIINRVGWSSGNAISILLKDTGGALRANTVDKAASSGATLDITYTTGSVNEVSIILRGESQILITTPNISIPANISIIGNSKLNSESVTTGIQASVRIEAFLPLLIPPPVSADAVINSDSELQSSATESAQSIISLSSDSQLLSSASINAESKVNINADSSLKSSSFITTDVNATIQMVSGNRLRISATIENPTDVSIELSQSSRINSIASLNLSASIELLSDSQILATPIINKSTSAQVLSDSRLQLSSIITLPQNLSTEISLYHFSQISAILSITGVLTITRSFESKRRNKPFISKKRK